MSRTNSSISHPTPCLFPEEIDSLPLPFLEVDRRGVVICANRAAHALHHPGHGDLLGTVAWDMLAADERDRSHAEFLSHIQTGSDPPMIKCNIFARSGSFRTYQIHRNLIRDDAGTPCGMRMVAVEISEMVQAFEEQRRSLQWLENALLSLAEAVVLIDALGIIRSMNAAAESLSGFRAVACIGKTIEELSPMIHYEPLDGTVFSHLAAIERPCRGIATLLNRRQEQVEVELSTSPIIDRKSGSVAGIVAILRKLDRK